MSMLLLIEMQILHSVLNRKWVWGYFKAMFRPTATAENAASF